MNETKSPHRNEGTSGRFQLQLRNPSTISATEMNEMKEPHPTPSPTPKPITDLRNRKSSKVKGTGMRQQTKSLSLPQADPC